MVGSAFKYSWLSVIAAESNFGLFSAFAINFSGGIIGVYTFTYLGAFLKQWFLKQRREKGMAATPIHSFRNKFLVLLRRKFGLKGIAILTPILLTIPIGIAIALTITKDKQQIIRYTLISCFLWTVAIIVPYKLFHVDLSEWLLTFIKSIF
jgi:hypothetical protein